MNNSIDDKVKRILEASNGKAVAICIWSDGPAGWLGCLLNPQFKQVQGSVPWNPYPTISEVLDSLERAATTLGTTNYI